MPTFGVVVPAHNAEGTISATLASVLNQTRPDFEVVVVDDGSQDRTADVVERVGDSRLRLVRQRNLGPSSARNTGISQTTAPLIAILDSDDLWLPNYLEEMGKVLEDDHSIALAYTDAWVLDDASGRVYRRTATASTSPPARPPSDARQVLALLVRSNFIYVSTTFRRQAIERIGGFDTRTRIQGSEDYELWLRFAAAGYRFARADAPLAIYRDRVGSLSADEGRMLLSERAVLELVLADYDLDDDLQTLVQRRIEQLDHRLNSRVVRVRRRLLGIAKRRIPCMWFHTPPAEVSSTLKRCMADESIVRDWPHSKFLGGS